MAKKVGDKTKAEIYREAFKATKTLNVSDNKKVIEWINKIYSDFKWSKQPSTEISMARSNEKKKKGIVSKRRKKTTRKTTMNKRSNSTIADVKKVAQLAKDLGGVEKLKEATELLEQIRKI